MQKDVPRNSINWGQNASIIKIGSPHESVDSSSKSSPESSKLKWLLFFRLLLRIALQLLLSRLAKNRSVCARTGSVDVIPLKHTHTAVVYSAELRIRFHPSGNTNQIRQSQKSSRGVDGNIAGLNIQLIGEIVQVYINNCIAYHIFYYIILMT